MNITREHFFNERLALMDEIAVLLLAVQTIRASGKAFENTDQIDAPRTKDAAMPVVECLERSARQLLDAALKGGAALTRRALEARTASGAEIRSLLPVIEQLARLEMAIYTDENEASAQSAKGTTIREYVLIPVKELSSAWR